MMKQVLSKDGTRIAYDQTGNGPPVILVTGALGFRSHASSSDLASALSLHLMAIDYDRRGRGDSGDTPPYAVEREVEDIEALIDAVGGSAYLYGLSSGAVLALEAASRFPSKVKKLAMYEPPFLVDDSRPPVPADYVAQLQAAIAAGKPGDAVEIFMTQAIRIPPELVEYMRSSPPAPPAADGSMQPPPWEEMKAVAHTLPYDGMIMGDTMSGRPLPHGKWSGNTAPTLVLAGGNSEPFFRTAAQALVAELPNARYSVLEGQDHAVSPRALAPVLIEFFVS
jgi:pimeloyl-ACP methyl ester carboxylesterase